MTLNSTVLDISKKLSVKEEQLDKILVQSRQIVRSCSNAIKAMHSHEMDEASKYLKQAEEGLEEIKNKDGFPTHINHILQEYTEARVVLSAINSKKIPDQKEIGVPEIPYLLGLLDAVGELKREMYECLRSGKKKDATKYFELMEEIFNELLPLRFSNAVLPEFRHKQDAARHQVEQARGELI